MKPTLAITMGDPLGIGAEIILKSLPQFRERASFKVFGDPTLLAELPESELISIPGHFASEKPTPELAGRASVAYLEAAMVAYEKKEIGALVTAPISKAHVKMAGFPFPGHTEFLAARTATKKFAMMMAGPRLKVTLVTIHEPLQSVAQKLSVAAIVNTIALTYSGLKESFGISDPRVAVCGLNPHAGEAGLIGSEEKEIIAPAIAQAVETGFPCHGPVVPDAVFHEAYGGKWDAVVCMYHDQGLIPFKMIHFQDGVNVTLGLPLIRTSPDHGTAFDIAGTGKADPASMVAALELALKILSVKK